MPNELERIFGSRIRAKALGWLFTHPDESFYVRQLATTLREDSTNLSRELFRLEASGILTSDKKGPLKYYRANRACPYFREMKGFVQKTVGVVGEIKAAIDALPGIIYAFVYGSFAKGEETGQSDVDLMIIGGVDLGSVDEALSDVEKRLGRSINYVSFNEKEYRSKRKKKDGFLMDVLKGQKVMLVGDEDNLKNP
ncbi:MAG: nucleotidyltransferase domain-containing protein [Deltaproteobacteria bacterium]|nr:nucleotidyltransferase domain-containing protein [Deltaproteobacteria bacterium]